MPSPGRAPARAWSGSDCEIRRTHGLCRRASSVPRRPGPSPFPRAVRAFHLRIGGETGCLRPLAGWVATLMRGTLNQKKAIKLLKANGWTRARGGKHQVKMIKQGCRPITLPQHKGRDYPIGLAEAIIKQARLR